MEGVQHAGRVFELVIDRVLVAPERVQRRDLDPLAEGAAAFVQPVAIGLTGSARDQVQEPDSRIRSASQIDHPGELLRAALARVPVVPDVLVHAQDLHVLEADGVVRSHGQERLDLGPDRVPGGAELPGQTLDRHALAPELADRPTDRAGAQQAPRSADGGVLFDERDHRAGVLEAAPAALAPPDPHRPALGASIIEVMTRP